MTMGTLKVRERLAMCRITLMSKNLLALLGERHHGVLVGTLVAMLMAPSIRAEWKTENFEVVPGWNAIYLHVDPSHESLEVLVQRTPVTQVWLWAPSTSTAQFVTSVQDSTDFGSSWISWDSSDTANSSLQKFIGNAAYLVYVASSYNDGLADQTVSYLLFIAGAILILIGVSTNKLIFAKKIVEDKGVKKTLEEETKELQKEKIHNE